MALLIFIICYLWIKLAELIIPSPALWTVKFISYAVALILVIIFALILPYGPAIRVG